MRTRTLVVGLIAIILGIVGYFVYTHFKEKPPRALIELLTKTEPPPPLPSGDTPPLTVPPEFTARIFSREVPNARVMLRDPAGTLIASLTKSGKVVALPDADHDGKADKTVTILENLQEPHGLAFTCGEDGTNSSCTLYVAETGELKSYAYDATTFTATYKDTLTTFPTGDGHFTRTLLLTPDKKHMLISIGSSCNVCNEDDARRATIQILDLETKEMTPYATGLRNSVFMAFDPKSGKLWATENGRDVIGDDIPPDEINIITQGSQYGWPHCYGNNIYDRDFDKNPFRKNSCGMMTPPHIALQAHSAALGLAFIPEEGWPLDMQNDLLVAFHGSWNRKQPTGYKVVRFDLDADRNAVGSPIDFMTGFLSPTTTEESEAIGRPVGIFAEAGRVYVSDDRAGAIYAVTPKP